MFVPENEDPIEKKAAGSDASCRHRFQKSSVASTGAGPAGFAESPTGAPTSAAKANAFRFVCA